MLITLAHVRSVGLDFKLTLSLLSAPRPCECEPWLIKWQRETHTRFSLDRNSLATKLESIVERNRWMKFVSCFRRRARRSDLRAYLLRFLIVYRCNSILHVIHAQRTLWSHESFRSCYNYSSAVSIIREKFKNYFSNRKDVVFLLKDLLKKAINGDKFRRY